MASLACQRAGGTCIGSGLGRLRHEPLDTGSSGVAAILKPSECSSPRRWSYCAVNDLNGVLLGSVIGSAGVEGRRFAYEIGSSVSVFPDTAQFLQRSESVLRNHCDSSVAERPDAINRIQEVDGETSAPCNRSQSMDDDTASTASGDEDDLSDTSSEALVDSTVSPQHDEGPLDCLTALNEALPAKRGLSKYYAGKSQSFSCLADVRSVAELAKPLNPFVKRRKTSSSLGKEACYRPKSLPASSISKRPPNSRRKINHVAVVTVPELTVPEDMISAMEICSPPNSIPLKCFSSPELGEADL